MSVEEAHYCELFLIALLAVEMHFLLTLVHVVESSGFIFGIVIKSDIMWQFG